MPSYGSAPGVRVEAAQVLPGIAQPICPKPPLCAEAPIHNVGLHEKDRMKLQNEALATSGHGEEPPGRRSGLDVAQLPPSGYFDPGTCSQPLDLTAIPDGAGPAAHARASPGIAMRVATPRRWQEAAGGS